MPLHIYENDTYNMYVWRTPGTVYDNDTYNILNTYEYNVVLAICAAAAQPLSFVGEIKVGKKKSHKVVLQRLV